MRTYLVASAILVSTAAGGAGMQDPIDRIREADLKADLLALAGDAMRGREAGTLDEMTASAWVAERARDAGLLPAGDNGTYFQFFPLERTRISSGSTVTLDGKALKMGRDILPDGPTVATVDAPVTVAQADKLEGIDLKNRALVVRYAPVETTAQDAGPRTVAALRTWLRGIA